MIAIKNIKKKYNFKIENKIITIMKGIKETIEEIKDIIVKLRAEAIDHTDDWKKYPHKRSLKDINERIEKLWKDFSELESEWEKKDLEISNRNNWINPTDLEKEATKRGMVSAEDYKKVLENQKPKNLPSDWVQQIADKDKYLQERNERPNITVETWDNYKNRPTLEQYESRPNITVENYNSLLNNQKPTDYESVKEKLEKLKNILGGRNLEQVQTDLNRISELERKPTLEQPKEAAEGENTIEKLLKEILEKLTKESAQQQQLITDLPKELEGILASEKPKPISSGAGTENEAKKKLQAELDKFNHLKIKDISDEECHKWLDEFKGIKKWILVDDEEKSEAVTKKWSELKEATDKLGLEVLRREWKQEIEDSLKHESEKNEKERIVLKNTDLTKDNYINFEAKLAEITNKKEMNDFGNAVLRDILEQRLKHRHIIEVFEKGKKVLEKGKERVLEKNEIQQAKAILLQLNFLKSLPGERKVFGINKIVVDINRLSDELKTLIESYRQSKQMHKSEEQQAQIIQNDKVS